MGHYLYRKAPAAASLGLAAALLLAVCAAWQAPLAAQRRAPEPPRGPRAIAVLEVVGETARLIPVVILSDGRYYDAGLYRATPRPMALEPGVVYEAERTGDSAGLFTVTDARRLDRSWYGLGDWKPGPVPGAPPPGSEFTIEGPQARGEFVFGSPKDASPPPDDDENGPPVLRDPSRPPSEGTEPPQAESPPAPDDDPDRPVMRRPRPEAALPRPDDDPARPVLRRGRPQADAPVDAAPAVVDPFADPAAQREFLVAVSDAAPQRMFSFRYDFLPGQEPAMRAQMEKLARADLTREAAARGVPAARLAKAALQNVHLRAFDLDYDGAPELVLTADLPLPAASPAAPPVTWHVALLARVDREGEARKLWSSVTSSDRLDVTRRLEIIDAVDVDGNGRADLLFRSHGRGGHGYAVYSVARYAVQQVFDGAWTAN